MIPLTIKIYTELLMITKDKFLGILMQGTKALWGEAQIERHHLHTPLSSLRHLIITSTFSISEKPFAINIGYLQKMVNLAVKLFGYVKKFPSLLSF